MADGTRPMHPLPMQRTDEISNVAESFNRLQHKLNEQEQRLAEMVRHDILTGLPNRRLIEERMDRELQRIQRSQSGMALLFLDIDGFKPVNDAFGHQTGDRVLIEIARRLCDTVRDIDTVARLGGDEFLILLTDTPQPLEAAKRVALQCIEALAEPIRIDDIEVRIGVSIGITTCAPIEAANMSTWRLVNQADAAMYQAKAAGRNCYAIQAPIDSPSHS
jgi:diguanylate cyclase (GGDEF)-like protein